MAERRWIWILIAMPVLALVGIALIRARYLSVEAADRAGEPRARARDRAGRRAGAGDAAGRGAGGGAGGGPGVDMSGPWRFAVALALVAGACSSAPSTHGGVASPPTPETPAPTRGRTPGDPAVVTRTVDGDTIHVTFRGHDLDVRLIGVDTPETVDPSQPVQCFGEQASRFTMRMLTGRTIRLEFDVERHDRYGRTLAYVWLRGQLFNRRLLAGGYAVVSTYPPDVKYVDVFTAAQRTARAHERGLWGACPGGGGGDGGGHRCDPAYPSVCIQPPPPDLDCGDVRFRHFRVLPPDPHNFDGDHNGIGCET